MDNVYQELSNEEDYDSFNFNELQIQEILKKKSEFVDFIKNLYVVICIICIVIVCLSIVMNGTLFFAFSVNKHIQISKYGIHFNIVMADILQAISILILLSVDLNEDFTSQHWKILSALETIFEIQRILAVISISSHRRVAILTSPICNSAEQFDNSLLKSNYLHSFVIWNISLVLPIFFALFKESHEHVQTIVSIVVFVLFPLGVAVYNRLSSRLLKQMEEGNVNVRGYQSSKVIISLTVAYFFIQLPYFIYHILQFAGLLEITDEESHNQTVMWFQFFSMLVACSVVIVHPIVVYVTIEDFRNMIVSHYFFRCFFKKKRQNEENSLNAISNDILLGECHV